MFLIILFFWRLEIMNKKYFKNTDNFWKNSILSLKESPCVKLFSFKKHLRPCNTYMFRPFCCSHQNLYNYLGIWIWKHNCLDSLRFLRCFLCVSYDVTQNTPCTYLYDTYRQLAYTAATSSPINRIFAVLTTYYCNGYGSGRLSNDFYTILYYIYKCIKCEGEISLDALWAQRIYTCYCI